MRLKSKISLFALFLLGMGNAHAQSKKTFKLTGNIQGLKDSSVYLAFGTFGKMKADTVAVKDHKFVFSDTISEPCYAMLFNHDYTLKVDLFLDKGNISVSGEIDSLYKAKITGSPVVNEYAAYNAYQQGTRQTVQLIFNKYVDAYNKKDSVAEAGYKKEFEDARNKQAALSKEAQAKFVNEHPNSIASAWELIHLVDMPNLAKGKAMYDKFSPTVKNSKMGKEIKERIDKLSSVTTGSVAPAFAQKDTVGNTVTLNAFKGKYVLLEFWASWCAPCRAESPNILKAYAKYQSKGFDILSVSLDNDKNKWIEAIKKDGLTWTQVSDLKGWRNEVASLYGIHAVPANFLIDPSGKIIAQNLRGEALNDKLAAIFQ